MSPPSSVSLIAGDLDCPIDLSIAGEFYFVDLMMRKSAATRSSGGGELGIVDWANDLPDEVLTCVIGKKLGVADRIRLAATCKSWSSLRPPLITLQKKPYLMFFSESMPHVNYLLDVSDNTSLVMDSPPELQGKHCVGSQCGILALIDEFGNPTLINPFTGFHVNLPKITTLPEIQPIYNNDPNNEHSSNLWGYRRWNYPLKRNMFNDVELKHFRSVGGIRKLVFSHDFTSAFALYLTTYNALIYFAPGDNKWTMMNTLVLYSCAHDVIYRRRQREEDDDEFLIVFDDGRLFSFKFTGSSIKTSSIAKKTRLIVAGPQLERFLLDISGDIWQVCKLLNRQTKKAYFKVWKLDFSNATWIEQSSLGDYSFFVGTAYSLPFLLTTPQQDIYGFKSNCIYFTDSSWRVDATFLRSRPREIGIYSMDDGSINTICVPTHEFNWPLPVWVMPSDTKFRGKTLAE